jgi:hypothetical protein
MTGGSFWDSNTYKHVIDAPEDPGDIDSFLEGGDDWSDKEYIGGNFESKKIGRIVRGRCHASELPSYSTPVRGVQ